jgi:hypothetical protein
LRDGADGRTEVEVDPSWASPVAAWGLGTVRATLAAVAEGVATRLDPGTGAGAQAAALRPVVTDLLRGFWLRPTLEEARAWGAFPFNLGEGHGSFTAPLAAPYGPGDLARALRGGRALKKHEHFWVEGALAMTPAPLRGVLGGLRGARRAIRA